MPTKAPGVITAMTEEDVNTLIRKHFKKWEDDQKEQLVIEKKDRKAHIDSVINKVNKLMSEMKEIHLPRQALPGVPYDVVPSLKCLTEQVMINYTLLKLLENEIFKEKTGITVKDVIKGFKGIESRIVKIEEELEDPNKKKEKSADNKQNT